MKFSDNRGRQKAEVTTTDSTKKQVTSTQTIYGGIPACHRERAAAGTDRAKTREVALRPIMHKGHPRQRRRKPNVRSRQTLIKYLKVRPGSFAAQASSQPGFPSHRLPICKTDHLAKIVLSVSGARVSTSGVSELQTAFIQEALCSSAALLSRFSKASADILRGTNTGSENACLILIS